MLADVDMRKTPQLRCACIHCDQFIEYLPSEVGQIAECPHCHQKSVLPPAPTPPPPPQPVSPAPAVAIPQRPVPPPSNRPRNLPKPNPAKRLLISAAAIIVIGGVILLVRL